jgi:organic radical activating enzyme
VIGTAAFSGTPGEINFVHVGNETIIQFQTGVGADIEGGIRITGGEPLLQEEVYPLMQSLLDRGVDLGHEDLL